MAGYAKLFSDIVDSSIWDEDPATCKVWVTLLALADQEGFVRGSPGWLAGKSRVTVEQCVSAVEKFKLPDARSRTTDFEGRRVEQLEDGWLILNYIAFRDRLSADTKTVATRERVRRHRERYKALRNAGSVTSSVSASASASGSVPQIPEGKPTSETGVNTDAGIPSLDEVIVAGSITGVLEESCRKFFDHYQGNQLWLNRWGRLIDWRHKLVIWGQNDRAGGPVPVNGAPRPKFVSELEKQKQATQELIDNHPANPDFRYTSKPTPQQLDEFKALKRRARELTQQISAHE